MWALFTLLSCSDPGGSPSPELDLLAVQGNLGGLVELDGARPEQVVVEVQREGAWSEACRGSLACWLAAPVELVRIRVDGVQAAQVAPATIALSLSQERSDGAWWTGEVATLEPRAEGLPEGLDMVLERERGGEVEGYDSGSWGDSTAAVQGPVAVTASADEPSITRYSLSVRLPGAGWTREEGVDSGEPLPLASAETELLELGRRWAWGEVHAHGDLSHDGCEDVASGCIGDLDQVGLDFFDSAVEQGLDFAVMSDHAEWQRWSEDGAIEHSVSVWERQQQAVAEALARWPGFVPLLGYEWTRPVSRAGAESWSYPGHRTVIFEEIEVCEQARVASEAHDSADTYVKALDGSVLHGGRAAFEETPAGLHARLDEAVAACGLQGRILVVPHHSAFDPPSPIDWSDPDNAPLPERSPVIEVYSEHGSSECTDLHAPHCAWRQKSEADYLPRGSVQSALAQGYVLGFVGGTDSHDGRPGTVHDGPSCLAIWDEEADSVSCHDYGGGLTGVMVPGQVDRAGILDGIFDRTTLATSGPRLPVRAFVRGGLLAQGDDALYLPGQVVPAATAERLLLTVEGLDQDWERVELDLLDPSGALVATGPGPALELELSPSPGALLYARVRLYADEADEEGERIWLSPWFFD